MSFCFLFFLHHSVTSWIRIFTSILTSWLAFVFLRVSLHSLRLILALICTFFRLHTDWLTIIRPPWLQIRFSLISPHLFPNEFDYPFGDSFVGPFMNSSWFVPFSSLHFLFSLFMIYSPIDFHWLIYSCSFRLSSSYFSLVSAQKCVQVKGYGFSVLTRFSSSLSHCIVGLCWSHCIAFRCWFGVWCETFSVNATDNNIKRFAWQVSGDTRYGSGDFQGSCESRHCSHKGCYDSTIRFAGWVLQWFFQSGVSVQ